MLLHHVPARVHVRHLQPRRGVQLVGGRVDGVGRDPADGEGPDVQQLVASHVHLHWSLGPHL